MLARSALILEAVAEGTDKRVTGEGDVPTICIGAGQYMDGQGLVIFDVLGLGGESYSLSKQYADLNATIREAVGGYVADVSEGNFPARKHAFDPLGDE